MAGAGLLDWQLSLLAADQPQSLSPILRPPAGHLGRGLLKWTSSFEGESLKQCSVLNRSWMFMDSLLSSN